MFFLTRKVLEITYNEFKSKSSHPYLGRAPSARIAGSREEKGVSGAQKGEGGVASLWHLRDPCRSSLWAPARSKEAFLFPAPMRSVVASLV